MQHMEQLVITSLCVERTLPNPTRPIEISTDSNKQLTSKLLRLTPVNCSLVETLLWNARMNTYVNRDRPYRHRLASHSDADLPSGELVSRNSTEYTAGMSYKRSASLHGTFTLSKAAVSGTKVAAPLRQCRKNFHLSVWLSSDRPFFTHVVDSHNKLR